MKPIFRGWEELPPSCPISNDARLIIHAEKKKIRKSDFITVKNFVKQFICKVL